MARTLFGRGLLHFPAVARRADLLCPRVGWSLGGVQDGYIRYKSVGDQYLGRVVAGLPLNRADFSVLPLHFCDNQDNMLQKCVAEMFPSLKKTSSLQDILKLCIASLVYHANYLRDVLPTSHPLLSMFRHDQVLDQLRSSLASDASPWMKPTGIPPHVELYKQLRCMQNSIEKIPPVLLEGISALIERKGVTAGNITKDQLETTIERLLERAGMTQSQEAAHHRQDQPGEKSTVHFYDGKFHLLPKSFEFPRVGPFGSWKLWWFGDSHHGYPPLKRIHAHDLPSPDMHKTFSDWSVLVRHITNSALSTELAIPTNMSEQEAVEVFRVGMDHLDLAPSTRKRRLAELSVTTILRLVREARKAKTPTSASATTSTTSTPPTRQRLE